MTYEHAPPTFVCCRARTWDDAKSLGAALAGHRFRGQADARWTLSTTLERTAARFGWIDGRKNRETVLLERFRRRAHQYLDHLPAPHDTLEWLALMQHHGAPTRLLDFSRSFYIASYFAMESAVSDAAVWAISDELAFQHTSNVVPEGGTLLDLEQESREVVNTLLSRADNIPQIMAAEPYRLSERLIAQQGLFMVPGAIDVPFVQNLHASYDLDPTTECYPEVDARQFIEQYGERACCTPIVKLILPHETHNTGIWDLDMMNITSATLFPGLDGFARSLHSWFRDVG